MTSTASWLPPRPDLAQLRRQAKELKAAAQSGHRGAQARIRAHLPGATRVTLASAQLVIAREYGFASWPELKAHVEASTMALAQRVEVFLHASVLGRTGRAARLLADDAAIGSYDFRTSVVLGDAARVRDTLARDPGAATRPDPRSGWPPLLGACMSRWHSIDVTRADGLTEVARLLLDAGADPNTSVGTRPGNPDYCSTLFAAAGCADNPAITALLLSRGARPDDHTIYLAAFHPGHACLRLLLDYARLPESNTALAAPISIADPDGVRLLLDAGADPNRPLPGSLFGEAYPDDPPLHLGNIGQCLAASFGAAFCCPVTALAAAACHTVPKGVTLYRNCRAHIDHTSTAVPGHRGLWDYLANGVSGGLL